jgi:HEAT repeat protein
MPGPAVTAALAAELEKLPAAGQAALLDTLAARGDRSCIDAVVISAGAKDESVRAAAASALGKLGNADNVDLLARLAAVEKGAVQRAARESLERITGPGVEERLILAARNDDPPERVECIRALASRRSAAAATALLAAMTDKDGQVRLAALDALAAAGPPAVYPKLIERLASVTGAELEAVEAAAVAVGGRMTVQADRTGPAMAALKSAPAPAKPALLRLLAAGGGSEALEAVRGYLKDNDAAVREAAVRALAAWPDEAAAADLLSLARDAERPALKALAMRGYLRLASGAQDEAARTQMLSQVRPIADTVEARKMLLAALGDTPSAAALLYWDGAPTSSCRPRPVYGSCSSCRWGDIP